MRYRKDGVVKEKIYSDVMLGGAIEDVIFENCIFNANISAVTFTRCRFIECSLNGQYNNCHFKNCAFDETKIEGQKFTLTNMEDCTYDGSKLYDWKIFGPAGAYKRFVTALYLGSGIHIVCGCYTGPLVDFTLCVNKKYPDHSDYHKIIKCIWSLQP